MSVWLEVCPNCGIPPSDHKGGWSQKCPLSSNGAAKSIIIAAALHHALLAHDDGYNSRHAEPPRSGAPSSSPKETP